MQLFWGATALAQANAARVLFRSTPVQDALRPCRWVGRIDAQIDLLGTTTADLVAAENALRVAVNTPYQDLVLKQDNGVASGTQLISATSLTGCRCVDGPNFVSEEPGEYVNQRTVSVAFEAEYIFPGAVNYVLGFWESVSILGNGGPRYVERFPTNADMIRQQVSTQSLVITIQNGGAVGHTKYPSFPEPMAGRPLGFFKGELQRRLQKAPILYGKGYINYPIEWYYEYRGNQAATGSPSLPPAT